MGIAQSSGTKRIQHLEAQLGVRLFNRTTRTVEPTDTARQLIDKAKREQVPSHVIEKAIENKMDTTQYAELERMLTAYWKKRLDIEALPTHEALSRIKANEDAGPLMNQLETWMHSPTPDENVDLAELLRPFRDLPVDTPGFESSETN